jgi:hypothetical protein
MEEEEVTKLTVKLSYFLTEPQLNGEADFVAESLLSIRCVFYVFSTSLYEIFTAMNFNHNVR